MTITPDLEAPRPAAGPGFADAVTFSFGDERTGCFGLARVGIADGSGSGLTLLFVDRETAAAAAEGGAALEEGAGWEDVRAGGLSTTVEAPLERWTIAFDGGADGAFALTFEAIGAPAAVSGGGMEGYEQLCRVRGVVRAGGRELRIECLGQRGHSWGAPDWERLTLARTLGAWLDPALAVVLSAFRPAGASDHEHELVQATLLEGTPAGPVAVEDPRLSTAYDEEGRQRRAGWELWLAVDGDEDAVYPRRGAGEVLCGTSLDLGRLRLDGAFFRFRMDGREGVGRYDVLRRV